MTPGMFGCRQAAAAGSLALAALLTAPGPTTQTAVAAPRYLLFEAWLRLLRRRGRRRSKAAAESCSPGRGRPSWPFPSC